MFSGGLYSQLQLCLAPVPRVISLQIESEKRETQSIMVRHQFVTSRYWSDYCLSIQHNAYRSSALGLSDTFLGLQSDVVLKQRDRAMRLIVHRSLAVQS